MSAPTAKDRNGDAPATPPASLRTAHDTSPLSTTTQTEPILSLITPNAESLSDRGRPISFGGRYATLGGRSAASAKIVTTAGIAMIATRGQSDSRGAPRER